MKMRLCRGTSRIAVIVGDVAIKIPRLYIGKGGWWWFRYGMRGNRLEHIRYSADTSGRLCPVIWGDPFGFICVMRRASQPKNLRYKHLLPLFSLFPSPVDFNTNNFGFIDRHLVLLDYGGI